MKAGRDKSGRFPRLSAAGRIVLRWINIVVALLTLLCAYGGYVDPRVTVIPALAVMVFPVMALICVMLFVADLFMCRRMSLWMIGTLALCAAPLLNTSPINIDRKQDLADTPADSLFTLMTYNVFGFENCDTEAADSGGMPTLEAILKCRADIVCLQESRPLSAVKRLYPDLAAKIADTYPHSAYYQGLTVLSRWPMERVPISIEPDSSFVVMCMRVRAEGHELNVVNMHLQSIGLTDDDKMLYRELTRMEANRTLLREAKSELLGKLVRAFRHRAVQARQVRELLDSLPGNVIACGDFNDVPGCNAVMTLRGTDMRDAYADGALGPTITYGHSRFYFRIDHILYRGCFAALYTRRDNNRGSDHYPLLSTFRWDGASP